MKKTICMLLIILSIGTMHPQTSANTVSFDFIMQDIKDIVYAVSVAQGISIVCDDTVVGKTSFRFSGESFEKAVQSFLLSNRLHAKTVDGVIVLSKIDINSINTAAQAFNISAYDIMPTVLFNKLSEEAHIPITYEMLPSIPVSLHVQNVKVEEAVSIVMQSFSGYTVSRNEKSISILKTSFSNNSQISFTSQNGGRLSITETKGVYSLDIQNGSFFESLETLLGLSQNQYSNLVSSDRLVTRLLFSHSDFDTILHMLCSQVQASFIFYDGVYIIYTLENASEILKTSNAAWRTFFLKYITSETLVPLLSQRFTSLKLLVISENKIQIETTVKKAREVEIFINLCDTPSKSHLVELQYITSEKMLAHLPPGIRREQFSDLGDGNSLFFTGSDEAYALLKSALLVLDTPSTIIGYDLLVLQVQKSESFTWKPNLSVDPVSIGDRTNITGHLGSVAALNLDVVSTFGYTFAAELQTAIGENKAQVYVDTKLQGISGSPIHFQNTNTYRYQDTAIDPDTGKPVYSGITREIIAGLILNIEGWVSGDGMVTTKVTASLSRRGADVSDNGNPPPTSEKIVTTEVRGKSGEPIVLSGLVQNDSTFVEEATPLIAKIPIIGWFFKSHQKTEEKNEMVIYLVPHVDSFSEEDSYDKF